MVRNVLGEEFMLPDYLGNEFLVDVVLFLPESAPLCNERGIPFRPFLLCCLAF